VQGGGAAAVAVCPDFVNASPTIKNHSFSIQKKAWQRDASPSGIAFW